MRYPWVNLALFVLLIAQAITGYFGFTSGRASRAWILWLHGAGAYALLWLLLGKGAIIGGVWRRRGRWSWRRTLWLLLTLLLLLTLMLGLLWTFRGPLYVGGFSLVTLHIVTAIPLLILFVWHSRHKWWVTNVRTARDRRALLNASGSLLAGFLLWQGARLAKQWWRLPAAGRRFTGSYETGSFSGRFPQVSWIADRPDPIDVSAWRLHIHGAVDQPLTLSYTQLRAMVQREVEATLDCTGGWYSMQMWRGVTLSDVLQMTHPQPDARSITLVAVSGYRRRFSLEEAAYYLLALDVAGQPLTHGHGFPLRLVAPDQRGVNWVKWISTIEVSTHSELWQVPLPLQ